MGVARPLATSTANSGVCPMSFAVASLLARAPIEIANTAEVATSFPNFLDVAADVGLKIRPGGDAP